MKATLLIAVMAGLQAAILWAASSGQEHPLPWDDVRDGARLTRCDADSIDHELAGDALEALDETVSALSPVGDPAPALGELGELLRMRCFEMAIETAPLGRFDSAESLRVWWESGGHGWLRSYLTFPRTESGGAVTLHLVVPPEPRHTLRPNAASPGSLDGLLCDLDDDDCRRSTAGWRKRAEIRLDREQRSSSREDDVVSFCREASEEQDEGAYQTFRSCLEQSLPRISSLPLGSLRAPLSGWLIVRGRRGHYRFCDEVRAYNLGNGDALRAASCSGLELREGGAVDFERTRERARNELDVGTVNLENLRETAWILLMSLESERVRRRSTYVDLPDGVPIFWIHGRPQAAAVLGGLSWSSAQTTLRWRVVSEANEAHGKLLWPSSYNDPLEDHAVELLAVAEQSWQEGCPRAAPPPSVLGSTQPPVNHRDADPDDVEETGLRLARSIASWEPSACRSETGR